VVMIPLAIVMRVHRIETEQMIIESVSFLRFGTHAWRPPNPDT